MPIILRLTCSTADCKSAIDGEEEINTGPLPWSVGALGMDHGHLQLRYGEGLIEDLTIAARAAGWHWDGSRWLCKECARAAIDEMLQAETVARSMNV